MNRLKNFACKWLTCVLANDLLLPLRGLETMPPDINNVEMTDCAFLLQTSCHFIIVSQEFPRAALALLMKCQTPRQSTLFDRTAINICTSLHLNSPHLSGVTPSKIQQHTSQLSF